MKLLKQNAKFNGTVVHYPELRFSVTGKPVCTFAIIIGNDDPIRCEAWNELAEAIVERDFQPGAQIEVTGSIRTHKWENREEEELEYDYISVTAIGV